MKKTTACLTGLLIAAGMIGCAPSINSAPPKAELLVALPDYCKSPDGLALLKDNSVSVSNMDWPFPKFKNSKHQLPATLSIIKLNQ